MKNLLGGGRGGFISRNGKYRATSGNNRNRRKRPVSL